jgi:hypothetical protein
MGESAVIFFLVEVSIQPRRMLYPNLLFFTRVSGAKERKYRRFHS